jgi:organic hydroperoxide reductase OsmC/OhrA
MHPYPHIYTASASGTLASAAATVSSAELPSFETAPPPQFGGPRGMWSPETLLCAALADCFILTFRGVARAASLEWLELECSVEGLLERADGVSRFTRFTTQARLTVPSDADSGRARLLLGQAEHKCLIANSLLGVRLLEAEVLTSQATRSAEVGNSGTRLPPARAKRPHDELS